jgi:hypothetical protein
MMLQHDGSPEAFVNALLIAAAPDLLAACEALLRFAEHGEAAYGVDAAKVKSCLLGNARAAISKAREWK